MLCVAVMPVLLLNTAGLQRGSGVFADYTGDGKRAYCTFICRTLGLRDGATFLLETEAAPTLSTSCVCAWLTLGVLVASSLYFSDETFKEGSISRRIHLWRPWSFFRGRLRRLRFFSAAPLVRFDVPRFQGVVHLAVAAGDDGQAYKYHPGDENIDAFLLSHAENLDQGAMVSIEVLPATVHHGPAAHFS